MRVLEESKNWTSRSCPGKVPEPCLSADLMLSNVPKGPGSGEDKGASQTPLSEALPKGRRCEHLQGYHLTEIAKG